MTNILEDTIALLKPMAQHVIDTKNPRELMARPRLLEWCGSLGVYKDMR